MEIRDQAVDIGEIVTSVLADLGGRAAGVTVAIPDDLPLVHTDPVLLERAVANLVDNALVHAEGASLRIEAGTVAGRVDLRVVDRGPGVPPEDRELVFQPFRRSGNTASRVGVGLGLAVARGFVEAVGGDLELEDTPGGGATLVVRLPAVSPPATGTEPDPDTGRSARPPDRVEGRP
jgi:two-component system sensor histidine kinase KdpD